VDRVLTFGTILQNIARQLQINQNYAKSDLLQLMRILDIYDMLKEPQMDIFDNASRGGTPFNPHLRGPGKRGF
jgi:hypothetical protein